MRRIAKINPGALRLLLAVSCGGCLVFMIYAAADGAIIPGGIASISGFLLFWITVRVVLWISDGFAQGKGINVKIPIENAPLIKPINEEPKAARQSKAILLARIIAIASFPTGFLLGRVTNSDPERHIAAQANIENKISGFPNESFFLEGVISIAMEGMPATNWDTLEPLNEGQWTKLTLLSPPFATNVSFEVTLPMNQKPKK